jgi:cob(I)alamin adenosyltransferase
MARIYTRTGDGGETSLFDGTRTPKANVRVDLYGDVDELNSWLGFCAALLIRAAAEEAGPAPNSKHSSVQAGENGPGPAGEKRSDLEGLRDLAAALHRVQADLLALGAILADPARSVALAAPGAGPLPFSAHALEVLIDKLDKDLPRLRSFILPGGHPAAGALHVARTVCRRVERRAVALHAREPLPTEIIATLNRLSDWLFVAARWTNQILGIADVTWSGSQPAGEDDSS